MPPPTEVFRYKSRDIFLMTDEEANRDTERWPSQTNIVSLCIRILPSAFSRLLPALTSHNKHSIKHCKTSSATHRLEMHLCSSVCLSLPVFALCNISPLDAGHSAQQSVTTDPDKVDGLGECLSDFYYFSLSLNADIMLFDIDILTCDYKKILDNVSTSVIRQSPCSEYM